MKLLWNGIKMCYGHTLYMLEVGMWYTHNGILFSLKNKGNSDISYNIDAKLNKPITKGQMLYNFIHIGAWSSLICTDRKKHDCCQGRRGGEMVS